MTPTTDSKASKKSLKCQKTAIEYLLPFPHFSVKYLLESFLENASAVFTGCTRAKALCIFSAVRGTYQAVQSSAFTFVLVPFLLYSYLNVVFCSSRTTKTSPALEGPSVTALPPVQLSEQVPLASPSLKPQQMDEEDSLSPHLLLPDSISQLEEFGRQKKWHKKQHKHHRQRQFNDLWVRIEDR